MAKLQMFDVFVDLGNECKHAKANNIMSSIPSKYLPINRSWYLTSVLCIVTLSLM